MGTPVGDHRRTIARAPRLRLNSPSSTLSTVYGGGVIIVLLTFSNSRVAIRMGGEGNRRSEDSPDKAEEGRESDDAGSADAGGCEHQPAKK